MTFENIVRITRGYKSRPFEGLTTIKTTPPTLDIPPEREREIEREREREGEKREMIYRAVYKQRKYDEKAVLSDVVALLL